MTIVLWDCKIAVSDDNRHFFIQGLLKFSMDAKEPPYRGQMKSQTKQCTRDQDYYYYYYYTEKD